jgi:hypothetical protein
MKILPSGDFAVIASENIKFIVTRQRMPSLGYRTSEEFCKNDGRGLWKRRRRNRLGKRSAFTIFPQFRRLRSST